jgi:hypothetical protein
MKVGDRDTHQVGIEQLFSTYQGDVFSVAFFIAAFARKLAGQDP